MKSDVVCFVFFTSGAKTPHIRDEGDGSVSAASSRAVEVGDAVSYTNAGETPPSAGGQPLTTHLITDQSANDF